jgi:protein-S-isoprenylcysteine O-methyltransferase Ste14
MLRVATIVLSIACFASFYWAIRFFFAQTTGTPTGMKLLGLVGALFTLLHLATLFFHPSQMRWALWTGLALYILSLGLFWWTIQTNRKRPLTLAYSEDSPEHLVMEGPYAWVRHPFYTSYTIAWIAGVVATSYPLLLVTVGVMVAMYIHAARLEESKFAETALAAEYAAYTRRTGRFFPRLR